MPTSAPVPDDSQPGGSVSDAFFSFARHVAQQSGVKVREFADAVEFDASIAGGGNEPSVRAAVVPCDATSWDDRLPWIEKQAARAILNAPLSARLKARRRTGKGWKDATVYRIAFGLRLLGGPPVRQRYTAYATLDGKLAWWRYGSDELYRRTKEETKPAPGHLPPPACRTALENVFPNVIEGYRDSPGVLDEVQKRANAKSSEILNLQRLYQRQQGKYTDLLGMQGDMPSGTFVNAEFRSRLLEVATRHEVHIACELLTVIRVECQLRTLEGMSSMTSFEQP